ncbi:hypothetical protein BDF20DRAFT_882521 [Mycotypha africana]|uniref:uncharacterized protein n=1 Tax=Mycotypha africana TaxID=64632 RepID=UPI0023014C90|nr:uncharacterized protein BDF20DRAFT_882521 [Mycotypha africana]KAI8973469.1 hypothetical protein BDF20DRAFT_882521 [Mycotypha africana]
MRDIYDGNIHTTMSNSDNDPMLLSPPLTAFSNESLASTSPPHTKRASISSETTSVSTSTAAMDIIKGFESWTEEDDKILMAHVLSRYSGARWEEAVSKLNHQHTVRGCKRRWEMLRDLLLRGATQTGIQGWSL